MIARIARVVCCLALEGALLAGLYWSFLNTPESNALTLAASGGLLAAIVLAAAWLTNTAVLVALDRNVRDALKEAIRGLHWFLVAAVPVAVTWWLVGTFDAWVRQHEGEIHAWFIARLGWSEMQWLLVVYTWVSRWLRWVAVPLASVSLLAALLGSGPAALRRGRLLPVAWRWRRLLAATLVCAAFLVLPWRLADWRPELPPNWLQLASAVLRLGTVSLLGLIGISLMLSLATPLEATRQGDAHD